MMIRAEKGEGDITLCHTLIRTVDRGNSYCGPQQLQLQLSQIFVSAWIHFCRGGRHILNYFQKSNQNVLANWVEKVVGEPGPVCSTTIAWRLLVSYNERKHSFCDKQGFCLRFNIMILLLVYNLVTANNDEIQYDEISTIPMCVQCILYIRMGMDRQRKSSQRERPLNDSWRTIFDIQGKINFGHSFWF